MQKNTVEKTGDGPKKWIVYSPEPARFPGIMEVIERIQTGALSAKSVTPAVIRKGVTS